MELFIAWFESCSEDIFLNKYLKKLCQFQPIKIAKNENLKCGFCKIIIKVRHLIPYHSIGVCQHHVLPDHLSFRYFTRMTYFAASHRVNLDQFKYPLMKIKNIKDCTPILLDHFSNWINCLETQEFCSTQLIWKLWLIDIFFILWKKSKNLLLCYVWKNLKVLVKKIKLLPLHNTLKHYNLNY